MRRDASTLRCSYVVAVDAAIPEAELRDLASYLSTLSIDCDVVVLETGDRGCVEGHASVLRWVSRYLIARREYFSLTGELDLLRAASSVARCQKVIVASHGDRYTPDALERVCQQLDRHEVVLPSSYYEPLPWWAGIDTANLLMHRAIDDGVEPGATLGFRRSVVRSLRLIRFLEPFEHDVQRLLTAGAEVAPVPDAVVRRKPSDLRSWLSERAAVAAADFRAAPRAILFLSLLPLFLLLSLTGNVALAFTCVLLLSASVTLLGARGWWLAREHVPFRACLFAPLALLERSCSVYIVLAMRLRRVAEPLAPEPARSPNRRAVSGE
jgi:hypothetical protein